MDRFVIVCLLKGETLKFHEKLVEEVCDKYKVKKQKLPAHFTIKAPFETDKIEEIETTIENFIKDKSREDILIDGFGHFRTDVVFMKIIPSNGAIKLHDTFIDELKKVSWLDWKRHEGKEKIFHCTIVTRLRENSFTSIWEYVNNYNPQFNTYFDNISILKWQDFRWMTYREYSLN